MTALLKLYVLDFGLFQVHENGRVIGIPGYVLQTLDGQHILVDTGFPAKYAKDRDKAAQEDTLGSFGQVLHLNRHNLPAGQLARIGLRPADIRTLILTHSHIDHVGGLADFAHAIIVIGKAERELAQPLYFGGRAPMEWPQARYRTVEGDTELMPGLHLLATPGHSPGHLSLLLHLPVSGWVLLAGDAISRPDEARQGFAGSWNPALAAHHAQRIMKLAEEHQAMVIFGHDPQQWPTLRKAPEHYG